MRRKATKEPLNSNTKPEMSEINLRALEPDDIDAIYRWENDPEVWTYSAAHQPFSRHTLHQFIDESSSVDIYASRQMRLMAVDNETNETVGCVDLYDFDPFNGRAAIGILVDRQKRRQGSGTAIVQALEEFCKRHLGLHQLYCDMADNNTACIRMFESRGFERCATMRQWMNGENGWNDAYRYQKIL